MMQCIDTSFNWWRSRAAQKSVTEYEFVSIETRPISSRCEGIFFVYCDMEKQKTKKLNF